MPLAIFDISTPASPSFEGYIQGWGAPNYLNSPMRVAVSGDYAYISAGTDDSLTVIDISDKTNPAYAGKLSGAGLPNYLNWPRGACIVGDYLYVVSYWDNSLTIIDISTPTAPVLVGSIQGSGAPYYLDNPYDVVVDGDYAYVAADDDYLTVIDVSTPATPTFKSNLDLSARTGRIRSIAKKGNYVYLGSAYPSYPVVVDVTDPANPAYVTRITTSVADDSIVISGNYAYTVSQGDDIFAIIEITNPLIPVIRGTLSGAGTPNYLNGPSGVFVSGNYAYVVSYADDSLTIIDISTPTAPALEAVIRGAANVLDSPRGVYISGDYAYVVSANEVVIVPTVSTDPATAVAADAATPNGTLDDDGGEACDCGFEWGETIAYSNTTPTQSRTTGQTFAQAIAGLDPNKTYHFRAFATNGAGTSYGADRTFTTLVAVPTATTNPVTGRGMIIATFNGLLDDDGGEPCECGFEWGSDITYGATTPTESKVTGEAFSQRILGLFPGTEYHYRAFATNSEGTSYGADESFRSEPSFSRAYALAREEL